MIETYLIEKQLEMKQICCITHYVFKIMVLWEMEK